MHTAKFDIHATHKQTHCHACHTQACLLISLLLLAEITNIMNALLVLWGFGQIKKALLSFLTSSFVCASKLKVTSAEL